MKEKDFMQHAIKISLKGNPFPNPFVGCVIVKEGKIVGQGFHEKYGENHAEVNALNKAGEKARNAEMYVSLEPCNHYGKTPPCTKKIIQSGIKKVVIALKDPNPLVNGKGIKALKEAGIEVETGLMEEKARKINKAFFKFQEKRKPLVILKAAISLDGKIATKEFDSKWISSEKSRNKVHEMRSKVDAVLVGGNTVIKDNPRLNARIENGRNPLKVIVTTKKISPDYNVFNDSNFLVATTNKNNFSEKKFEGKVLELKTANNLVDLKTLLFILAEKKVSSILVEGGSAIFTSFLTEKLADKLMLFISPKILGNDSIPVFGFLGFEKVSESPELKNPVFTKIGSDVLFEADLK
ncbi:MAG: riboflavin biosynthesis protein RibD [Candidatus Diapherotrites archaeon CG10_big_fil_rev_8_21_14_0_10_31_34]|nr:MAG: riboflavin biosynthesis protein RibD [Candidatus Diapherotrites archaeon CG10_big_fil_rev_8_21_14_0_10_31_34]